MRILVTGGTGKTGRRVVARLQREGHTTIVASRTGGPDGVSFDWADLATYGAVATGVDAAYLVAPSGAFDLVPAMRPFLERLIDEGVGRLVLLSAASLPMGGPMMGAVHAWLSEHAAIWSVLRPSWFMQNFTEQQHRETIARESAVYSAAADGRVGWIDTEDIAAVAATVLTDRGRANGDLILTGPTTLSYDDLAETIGQAVGRPITHRRLSVAELTARFEASGMPSAYASTLAGMDGVIAAGSGDFITDTVAEVAGSPATWFQNFATCNAGAWTRA